MTNVQKKAYLDAELCLMWNKPSRTSHPSAVSVFDDFQAEHQLQAYAIHDDVSYMPLHLQTIQAWIQHGRAYLTLENRVGSWHGIDITFGHTKSS